MNNAKLVLKGAKLLCMQHANNVSGTIFPIKELFGFAKRRYFDDVRLRTKSWDCNA